jgi:hypothetical protein
LIGNLLRGWRNSTIKTPVKIHQPSQSTHHCGPSILVLTKKIARGSACHWKRNKKRAWSGNKHVSIICIASTDDVPIDELIEKADEFIGVFPGIYLIYQVNICHCCCP